MDANRPRPIGSSRAPGTAAAEHATCAPARRARLTRALAARRRAASDAHFVLIAKAKHFPTSGDLQGPYMPLLSYFTDSSVTPQLGPLARRLLPLTYGVDGLLVVEGGNDSVYYTKSIAALSQHQLSTNHRE